MNKHNHRVASTQPLMHYFSRIGWVLLRADGTDHTEDPTGIDPLTQKGPS